MVARLSPALQEAKEAEKVEEWGRFKNMVARYPPALQEAKALEPVEDWGPGYGASHAVASLAAAREVMGLPPLEQEPAVAPGVQEVSGFVRGDVSGLGVSCTGNHVLLLGPAAGFLVLDFY